MSEDKKIEIVSGDGKDLDISPVYEHLNAGKPRNTEEKKNIVIPKTTENKDKDKKEENDDSDDENKVSE